ncbi:septation protein SepH [Nocardioides massiliensis]|uniref:DUF3071 domain-containing protein n=1 Tax=Nocardioides massiliensis TaxID=1325935 RepID=A0ABT9NSL9_9ACTN|nr:septation protein SepH [Nocardioides massiliensis]MDP9823417.1 hypothetical protein [Nocardioides massiliensis]
MQQLSVVGLSSDGNRLMLINDAGEEFAVAVDSRLRAALRGDQTRLGQLEISMESALRPRDIQARIRAGESAEAVAQAAQTTVDKIMAFAAPVLAERAHMADRAQRSSVRRGPDAAPGGPRTLGDAVAEALLALKVSAGSVEWDAWRREDGRWRLVADYQFEGKAVRATFSYDVPGQYVVPEDDAARILIGEKQPRSATPSTPKQSTPTGPRRLAAVADNELPLGDDAIALVHDLEAEVEEITRLRAAQEDESGANADQTEATDADATGDPDREQTVDLTEAADAVRRDAPATDETAVEQDAEPAATDEPKAAPEPEKPAEPEPAKPKGSRKRRSSVPSWDEIMFGGGGGRRD